MSEPVRIDLPSGEQLEGRFWAGPGAPLLLAPPHPEYGGELGNPVVQALVAAARGPCLAFNWRGVGASEGRISGDAGRAHEDFDAALCWLLERCGPDVIAGGYSFGAGTAVRFGSATGVTRVVAVAPPVAMLSFLSPGTCPIEILVGDDDMFAPLGLLRAAVSGLPDVRLTVLPDVDHFFSRGVDELRAEARRILTATAP